jgi:hypothetical protein
MPENQRPRHLFALSQAERPRGSSTGRWSDAARLGEDPSNGRVMPIKQPRDLVQRLALPPAVPHQGLVAIGVLDPRPSLHPQHSCCLGSYRVLHRSYESAAESGRLNNLTEPMPQPKPADAYREPPPDLTRLAKAAGNRTGTK